MSLSNFGKHIREIVEHLYVNEIGLGKREDNMRRKELRMVLELTKGDDFCVRVGG